MVSIDPGKSTGWARFAGGVLVEAGVTDGDDPRVPHERCGETIVEVPSPGDRRAPVNDLLVLARRAGLVAGRMGGPVRFVEARRWKGQIPKPVMIERIKGRLAPAELARVEGLKHDAIDAVGLGLWVLGRLSGQPLTR